MRKILLSFILLLLTVASASAQLRFGVKGGVNISKMSLVSDVLGSSNRCGFFAGPTVRFSLPVVGLGMETAVLYNQRTSNLGVHVVTTEGAVINVRDNVTHKSIAIPVNIRYQFLGIGDTGGIYAFTGPQFDFTVGGSNILQFDQYEDWTFRSSNFSWNLGLGVTMLDRLQLSVNYNIGLNKTGDIDKTLAEVMGFDKSYENTWQIALAYFF